MLYKVNFPFVFRCNFCGIFFVSTEYDIKFSSWWFTKDETFKFIWKCVCWKICNHTIYSKEFDFWKNENLLILSQKNDKNSSSTSL